MKLLLNILGTDRFAPKDEAWDRAVAYWKSFQSDAGAQYDKEIEIDVGQLEPVVTWGTNPGQAIEISEDIPNLTGLSEDEITSVGQALEYVALVPGEPIAGTEISWAFLGSCTNGRIEDLRLAAKVLKGNKVHQDVTMYVVPGSEQVRAQAIEEGLDKIFEEAGADFRMPGCSMCLGMNDDLVPSGEPVY